MRHLKYRPLLCAEPADPRKLCRLFKNIKHYFFLSKSIIVVISTSSNVIFKTSFYLKILFFFTPSINSLFEFFILIDSAVSTHILFFVNLSSCSNMCFLDWNLNKFFIDSKKDVFLEYLKQKVYYRCFLLSLFNPFVFWDCLTLFFILILWSVSCKFVSILLLIDKLNGISSLKSSCFKLIEFTNKDVLHWSNSWELRSNLVQCCNFFNCDCLRESTSDWNPSLIWVYNCSTCS